MALTAAERTLILGAGLTADQTMRGRAVATVLSKRGEESEEARRLLAQSYLQATVPSFHLVPRGDAMLPSDSFDDAYDFLAERTNGFASVTEDSLHAALVERPATLAPLRMIAGLTYNELAVAIELATGTAVGGGALRAYEREAARPAAGSRGAKRRAEVLRLVAKTIIDVVNRDVLEVPAPALPLFHSKLDKRDTLEGWESVERDADEGVPYSALLYQRYVGGLWRQVQDAYSEVKGDSILELPLASLLEGEGIPFWRSPPGATGARQTAQRYGIEPGPDFVIPPESPAVIIESKVGEDGGTVRDKAARIQALAGVAEQRGFVLCAVVDGKGWRERLSALAGVVIATKGRTFSLATLPFLLEVPEIKAWRGTAPKIEP